MKPFKFKMKDPITGKVYSLQERAKFKPINDLDKTQKYVKGKGGKKYA